MEGALALLFLFHGKAGPLVAAVAVQLLACHAAVHGATMSTSLVTSQPRLRSNDTALYCADRTCLAGPLGCEVTRPDHHTAVEGHNNRTAVLVKGRASVDQAFSLHNC